MAGVDIVPAGDSVAGSTALLYRHTLSICTVLVEDFILAKFRNEILFIVHK